VVGRLTEKKKESAVEGSRQGGAAAPATGASAPAGQALAGLKVVECATVIAAPLCGRMLADFGADVIHVEHPVKGDHLRQFGHTYDGVNPLWKYYSRNKKAVTLDISKPKGRDILFRMLADADIFIENFRPGRLEEWGIHYADLSKLNPRLIMIRLTGFGQYGPYSEQPGFGTLMEAMSGFAEMTGEANGPPTLPQFALADSYAAYYALSSAMFAIYHRDVLGHGKGQVIDVALWEAITTNLGPNALVHQVTGEAPRRIGNRSAASAPRNTYRTSDGRWVAIAGATQTTAERMFAVMGKSNLLKQPKFATNPARLRHVDEVDAIVGEWIARHTREEVTRILRAAEVPVGPVYDVRDIMADPHAQARDMFIDCPDGDRRLKMEGVFPKMGLTPGEVRHAGRDMGADNASILGDRLGLTAEELAELKREGII